jgi:hypothetical protein
MKRLLIYSLLLGWTFSSCQRDVDQLITTSSGPSTTWYATIPDDASSRTLKRELKLSIPEDSLIIFANGTTAYNTGAATNLFFSIPQGSVTQGGGSVYSGKAYLSTRLMRTKGDMIRMGIPTNSGGSLLVSGGAIYVSLSDSIGMPLSVMPNRNIMINYPDSPFTANTRVFHSENAGSSGINWAPAIDSTLNYVSTALNSYLIYSSKLGWINNASYYNNFGQSPPQTQIAIELPNYYTNANTIVFASFDNMKSVVELAGDAITRQFRTGEVPIGSQVTIIVMSKQANDYFMGSTQTITATATQGYQTVVVNPTISSFSNIENYLSTL